MPSATNANRQMPKLIPLRFKAARRFYEPILLEAALKKIRPPDFFAVQRDPNTLNDSVDSAEQTFKCFVNRLAQVCDNLRGENGATVSGIAVLEEPEGVHYIIGSNNRKASKLREVELFVEQLLNIIAKPTGRNTDSGLPAQREALWHILDFNRNRVSFYVANTAEWLGECISDFDRRHKGITSTLEASKFRAQLSELGELVKFENEKQLEGAKYFAACEKLFSFIHNAQRQKFGDSISEYARDGQIDISKPWMELRHFVGRLHSYQLAVETILRAKKLSVRLFHDFKVTVIPSAPVIPHPLSGKRPVAREILGRMFSSEEIIERYRAMAEELQSGLDEKILGECNDSSQTHMVHAEVLVLDYVLSYLRSSEDANFWNKWRYIGASKPTCRLCNYYFARHPSRVKVRESHDNLYPHWRVPDVFDKDAMAATERILNEMNQRTREDAIRSLEDQAPRGRVHDSNSFSGLPGQKSYRTDTSVSELVSGLASLAIPDTVEEEDGQSTAGESGEQEEEGIIKVFRGRKPRS
ncbi:hypothetical protein V8C35DRAFT_312156 [Trichoderma chlorosporum]